MNAHIDCTIEKACGGSCIYNDSMTEEKLFKMMKPVFDECYDKRTSTELGEFRKDLVKSHIVKEVAHGNAVVNKFNFELRLKDERIPLCRSCFQVAYNISSYKINEISNLLKESEQPMGSSIAPNARKKNESSFSGDLSIGDVRDYLEWGLHSQSIVNDDCVFRHAMAKKGSAHLIANAYLDSVIHLQADLSPEKVIAFVSDNFKYSQYDNYVDYCTAHLFPTICKNDFLDTWNFLYPFLLLRRACNVCGKCALCAHLDAGKKLHGKNDEKARYYTAAHLLHRAFYMGERDSCVQRVMHAASDPNILHIMIDIMESYELKIPHFGTQNKSSKTINSMLIGALVLGDRMRLYRTTNMVKKGGNVIMHVILREIEIYANAHNGNYPELVYLQVIYNSDSVFYLKIFYKIYFTVHT